MIKVALKFLLVLQILQYIIQLSIPIGVHPLGSYNIQRSNNIYNKVKNREVPFKVN